MHARAGGGRSVGHGMRHAGACVWPPAAGYKSDSHDRYSITVTRMLDLLVGRDGSLVVSVSGF